MKLLPQSKRLRGGIFNVAFFSVAVIVTNYVFAQVQDEFDVPLEIGPRQLAQERVQDQAVETSLVYNILS